MNRCTRFVALTCLSLLFIASVGVPAALAAPVAQWESIAINVGNDADTPVLMVYGVLPDSTKLPATVELAAPQGSTLQWAGEILGGDPAADPEVTPTKSTRDGQDIYAFTLTKAHVGQLEVEAPPSVTVDGDVYTVQFSLPAWSDVNDASVAVQIPATARLTETATGTASLAPGPTGFQYYQKTFSNVKKGEPLAVTFSYTIANAPAGAVPGSTNGGPLVPLLLAGVALALGVGLIVGVRRKLRGDEADASESAPATRVTKVQGTRREEVVVPDTAVVEDEDDAEEVASGRPRPRTSLALIGTLVIIALAVGAGVVAASQGGQAKSVGTTISKTFASGEACTNATIPLALPEGTDTAKAAEELFGALAAVPSVTVGTVDLVASTIHIGYCESQANEDMIRAALAPTGYVAAGSAIAPAGAAGGAAESSGTTP